MAERNVIDRLNRLFINERILVDARDKTPDAVELRQRRSQIAGYLREIGKSGDIDAILAVERRFLENDLAEYANSRPMKDSLQRSILELGVAEKLLAKVRDPAVYKAVDESHALPKNRTPKRLENSVPNDEARQFFGSQATRLLNMDKARLAAEEKAIVEVRKQNMRVAERVYAGMQRQALGLASALERGNGLSL